MDLSTLKPTTRTIEIKHPATGHNLGIRVTLCSMDDERLTKVKREITDRRLYLEQRGKSFKAEEVEANAHKLMFTAALGWEWYNPTGNEGDEGYDPDATPHVGGETLDFNQKNFLRMVREYPWFKDQINEELGETKAFFDGSKSS